MVQCDELGRQTSSRFVTNEHKIAMVGRDLANDDDDDDDNDGNGDDEAIAIIYIQASM